MISRPYPKRMCGELPPAAKREPYCPVCEALFPTGDEDDEQERNQLIDTIFDKLERIQHIHRQYRQKVRR